MRGSINTSLCLKPLEPGHLLKKNADTLKWIKAMQHVTGTDIDLATATEIADGELSADFQSAASARFDPLLLRLLAAATTLAVATPSLAATTLPTPTATELMDWAQDAFPAFFPGSAL